MHRALSPKENASMAAGVIVAGREAATEQNGLFECSARHISSLVDELRINGLGLGSTSAETQCATLLKVLKYLGARGLNTYEGTAAGFARLATRIQDLEADGWLIASHRENIIGPDGLFHPRVARYVLIGRRCALAPTQSILDLEVPA